MGACGVPPHPTRRVVCRMVAARQQRAGGRAAGPAASQQAAASVNRMSRGALRIAQVYGRRFAWRNPARAV